MKIDIKWDKPIVLRDGSRFNRIYHSESKLKKIPAKPGVYVFARRHGRNVYPLYIGQAGNLRSRVDGQFNNLRLMMGLKNVEAGRRILLVGRLILHRGQRMKKVLDVVESALIKRALADGHDLINQQGTKTRVHVIRSKGNNWSRQIAPLAILIERRRSA
jgi:hypothetical protein